MIRNFISIALLSFFSLYGVFAQNTGHKSKMEIELNWSKSENLSTGIQGIQYFPWTFENAEYEGNTNRIPVYHARIEINPSANISALIRIKNSKKVSGASDTFLESINANPVLNAFISKSGDQYYANFSLIPLFENEDQIELITSFIIEFELLNNEVSGQRQKEYAPVSELNEGSFYKIAIKESGIYRLDANFLSSNGINTSSLIPSEIQLFGNGGGPLPESLLDERIDDLVENPMHFVGDSDNSFESDEYFLFFAQGPDIWDYNEAKGTYEYIRNIYDSNNYYFLKIDGTNGLRIASPENPIEAEYISSSTDVPQVHEIDKTNLLAQYDHTEGTGQSWYGESFFSTKNQDFIQYFDFENRLENEVIQLYVQFAARNSGTSTYTVKINDETWSKNINGVSVQSPEATYARNGVIDNEFLLTEKIEEISISTNTYQGWLDKIAINHRSGIEFDGTPIFVSDRYSLQYPEAGFEFISSEDQLLVWDITRATDPIATYITAEGNNKFTFAYSSDELHQFVIFDPNNISKSPLSISPIENQNLHDIFRADMLIVYHSDFVDEARKLATHRNTINNMEVETVDIEKIFNEFSSGRQDPTAIRDFAKMIHDRDPEFRFLLLFGDGSYDYKAILNANKNDNYIPVYETKQSLNPISGYVSDDYFALLSDDEGIDLNGDLDIAVGRLPVRSSEQAELLVNKIIDYESSPANDGDWQNRIAMIADDEDSSRHLDQTESVAKYMNTDHPDFNIEKIYLDAFQQQVNPGGHRYPEANKSINDNIFKGVLAMTYIGHGGPGGFAQERVLKHEDIFSWNNESKLPLLITATCSFAGFDDPAINTAGEASILKENGGVIALYSTVRLVYSNENSKLINAVFNQLFKETDGEYLKLGEVLRFAKNSIGNKDNKRKFFLFGDPAMQLAIPEFTAYTTSINDIDVQSGGFPDTLHALSKVKIEGYIGDKEGNIRSDFNGVVYPTVFDKSQIIETLSNDSGSPKREFEIRKNILFKGSASVKDGQFSFEFIIPKDIDYRFGEGKISYFYSNGDNLDGKGSYTSFIIGGSSEEAIEDNEGPEIKLYMNHTDFEDGDITNNRPVLLAHINDESGINISGTSIGHDLNGVLDDDIQQYYKLNDFFQSATDDYSSGVVTFPLDKLEPGLHYMYVEAWDVLNNKGSATIEFVVADEEEQVIKNLFAYPNPSGGPSNFSFEHTLPDSELDLEISVFDLTGRLVHSRTATAFTDGHSVKGILWDGQIALENIVSNGIYIYTIKVYSNVLGISLESELEKLVILK